MRSQEIRIGLGVIGNVPRGLGVGRRPRLVEELSCAREDDGLLEGVLPCHVAVRHAPDQEGVAIEDPSAGDLVDPDAGHRIGRGASQVSAHGDPAVLARWNSGEGDRRMRLERRRARSGAADELDVPVADALQELGVDVVRSDGLEQHRYGDGVDQSCGNGDVAVPQTFQVESHFLSVHPDIGDGAARRDNFFA